jgi:Ca-activated chloride channel family protein
VSPDRFTQPFSHPEWLPALVAIVAVAALAVALARRAARHRRHSLLGPGSRGRGRDRTRDAVVLVGLGAIGLALLGPRIGETTVRVPSSGVDVVFLVDVSRSMDARDVPPSRLDRAKRGAEELLARLAPGDRAALAAFGSRGVLLAPLTPDRGALLEFLSALDTRLVHPAGSNLGDGMRAALSAFSGANDRPRLVFVLSDGEDPERQGSLGAAEAARAGVRILAAALGSDLGADVPDHDVSLRDGAGRIVRSRRDVGRLGRLAEATGGEVFPGDAWGDFDFENAATSLRRDASAAPGGLVTRRVRAPRVFPLAAAAFGLLLGEALPRPRRPRALVPGIALATPLLVLLLLGAAPASPSGAGAVGPIEARLRTSPGDPRLLVRLGLARFERGENAAAARAFAGAAVVAADPGVAAIAYYDLGVTALAQGDLETARDAFFDALALAPGDREARFNLEWTLAGLAARPPASRPPQPESAPLTSEAEGPAASRPPAPTEARPTSATVPVGLPADEPPPSEAERARWLSRVDDDPTRSIRSAARREGRDRRRYGPAW